MFRIGSASWSAHPLIRHSATGSLSKFRSLEPQTLAVLPPWRIKSVKGMSRTAYTFRQMWKHSAWAFQTPPEYYVSVCLGEEESLMDVAAIGMKADERRVTVTDSVVNLLCCWSKFWSSLHTCNSLWSIYCDKLFNLKYANNWPLASHNKTVLAQTATVQCKVWNLCPKRYIHTGTHPHTHSHSDWI